MKIILVIENEKGKNILFITNSMQSLTLVEALQAVQTEEIENTHTVRDNYIRSNPNKTAEDNLDILTISSHQLEKSLHNYDEIKDYPALQGYEEIRNENIKISTDVIFIDIILCLKSGDKSLYEVEWNGYFGYNRNFMCYFSVSTIFN